MRKLAILTVAFACCVRVHPAFAVHLLTTGKVARFDNRGDPSMNSAVIAVGRDHGLQTLVDPTCPTSSAVAIEAYLQSTYRDATLARVTLDCAKWSATAGGFRYADPTATVRSIRYSRRGLRIEVRGAGFTPIAEPVGFVQGQLEIGTEVFRARFHNFKRNDARLIQSRKPSTAAAAGEAGFWDVLSGANSSEENEQAVSALLQQAIGYDASDGRSHFLLAMLHLYRFGQRVTAYDSVSPDARAELVAANAAFASAVPLLWDDASASGDSRVPGFAAAAKYMQGFIDGDAALRDAGLADLARSVEINAFFNVFDYIPVLQALPPADPAFQEAFSFVTTYLNDPNTLQCVVTQPEICSNAGFAPYNIQGSLTLFGDLYAKAGDMEKAKMWYDLANVVPGTNTWPFASALQDRRANLAARIALYADSDANNDPPLIGADAEACAACHAE